MFYILGKALCICTKILLCFNAFSKLFLDKGICPNWKRKCHLKSARLIPESGNNLSIKNKLHLIPNYSKALSWNTQNAIIPLTISWRCFLWMLSQLYQKKTFLLRPITNSSFLWPSCFPQQPILHCTFLSIFPSATSPAVGTTRCSAAGKGTGSESDCPGSKVQHLLVVRLA